MSRIFVAEITAAIDSLGTEQVFYACTGSGFSTKPTDTPANTPISPSIINAGNYRREMFSGNFTFGAVRPAFGEAILFNGDAAYDSWADYGLDGRSYILRMGEEGGDYPDAFTTVFIATVASVLLTEKEVKISLKDSISFLEKSVLTKTFLGTGGVEGPAALKGIVMQRMFGDPAYTPVQLINESLLLYLVCAESNFVVPVQVFDGGIELLSEGFYESLSDVISITPSAGKFMIYADGPTYIRLGSPPAFDIRVLSAGYQASGESWSSTELANEAGVFGTFLGALFGFGRLITDASMTYIDLFDEVSKAQLKSYGFDRLDRFKVVNFDSPVGDPVYEFNRYNTLTISRSTPDGMIAPVYKLTAKTGETWPCQLANGVGADLRDKLTRSPFYAVFSDTQEDVLLKHKSAQAIVIDLKARFQNIIEWQAFKDKFMELFGVERTQIKIECLLDAENLGLDINDVVSVYWHRFGLSDGKLMRIISVRYNLAGQRVELVLWG